MIMEWIPRTQLGKAVAAGQVTLDEIFARGRKIKEPEIIDALIPGLQNEVILIGGSPGKGGGIRRTPTRRTARMHRSGRRYMVSAVAVVGNEAGYLGIGKANALEHRTAIEKAIHAAKLNIIPIQRGCGSWECGCGEPHSIPVEITGKAGSVRITLLPAPKGIGLAINDEAKKIARLAGIKDVWAKSYGETRSRLNYAFALYDAFKRTNRMKMGGELDAAADETAESDETSHDGETERGDADSSLDAGAEIEGDDNDDNLAEDEARVDEGEDEA